MPHLIPPYMLQPRRTETPVLFYGRPDSEGIPAPLQWVLGVLLGGVVTAAAGLFFAFFAGGGPVNSTLAALLAPLVLDRYPAGLRSDPHLRPMKLAARTGAVAGLLCNCLFLASFEWG